MEETPLVQRDFCEVLQWQTLFVIIIVRICLIFTGQDYCWSLGDKLQFFAAFLAPMSSGAYPKCLILGCRFLQVKRRFLICIYVVPLGIK